MLRRCLPSLLALSLLAACAPPEPAPVADPAGWMVAHAEAYLSDRTQRRAWLESSMWMPELPYARKRLDGYALPAGGWDLLPEMAHTTRAVSADGALGDDRVLPLAAPTTLAGWRALGERVFHELPMRRDAYVEWLVERPELWSRAGLRVDAEGAVQGLTAYTDVRGDARVGITCSMCHGGDGVPGRAARDLDLGWARAQYVEAHGREAGPYADWGRGRLDVTDDPIDDPLAIADLWSLPWQTHLNTSGAVQLDTPAALAIRFETQFITGHAYGTRPPRVLTWALAVYVLTLDRPAGAVPTDHPGRAVFEQRCAGCHDPARGYGGGLVPPDGFISDHGPAHSPMRGTGLLKVPGLLGVGAGGPYLHDGRFETLEALVAAGHPYGAPPTATEAADLVDFLRHL